MRKMEALTVTLSGRGRPALCIKCRIFTGKYFFLPDVLFLEGGVLDKHIFSWQACFIWEIILELALHLGKYSMFTHKEWLCKRISDLMCRYR